MPLLTRTVVAAGSTTVGDNTTYLSLQLGEQALTEGKSHFSLILVISEVV